MARVPWLFEFRLRKLSTRDCSRKQSMFSFFVGFLTCALLTLGVIKLANMKGMALDSDLDGAQKFHVHAVTRIGGIPIFLAVVLTSIFSIAREPALAPWLSALIACGAIALSGGIAEDYTGKVAPSRRLWLTMLAALLAYWLLDARLERLDLPWGPLRFESAWIVLPATVIAVAGIANAVNIIDGFNGLASMVSICMLMSLAYVAFQIGDMFVLVAALIVAGSAAGFLIWNYPVGLIFLGDGGAYFIGFLLGELSLLLVMRNPEVSTWYAALLLIYPAFETLFSAYRRMFVRGKSPAMPDGIHLHSLIFRRIVRWTVGRKEARALMKRNARTSPYLWLFSLMAVMPATLFWANTVMLMVFCLLFIISYVWLYARIVRFKSPRWLFFHKRD